MQSDSSLKQIISTTQPSADAKRRLWPENSRILLVEDNYVNQIIAQGTLASLGLKPDVATNGEEAIQQLLSCTNESPYTLILMDCNMPILDGYEACARIRTGEAGAQYKNLPVIAMTASVNELEEKKCRDIGMNDFIGKPIDRLLLNKVLKTWLQCGVNTVDTSNHQLNNDNSTELWSESELLTRVGGKTKRLNQSIDAFMSDIKIQLKNLNGFISTNDLISADISVHSIKGLAGNLAAHLLFNAATSLSESIEQRQPKLIGVHFSALKQCVHELEQCFQEYSLTD
jgi:CheY-like chemotaxis protein